MVNARTVFLALILSGFLPGMAQALNVERMSNPCSSPKVMRNAKTIDTVRNPNGRYMKRMRKMGEKPFGEPTSPAMGVPGQESVDFFLNEERYCI